MQAESNVTHMIAICDGWSKDATALRLWDGADTARIYDWCKAKRGRIPNLDRKTSGGGTLYKMVQILDKTCSDEILVEKRQSELTRTHAKEDARAWLAPLAAAVLQLALVDHAKREEADDDFFDD